MARDDVHGHFFRTSGGAEIDLVLHMPNGRLWAVEIKRSAAPRIDKGFHVACEDLKPERRFVVYSGEESYISANGIEMITVQELARLLTSPSA